jgi:hypothetical protein
MEPQERAALEAALDKATAVEMGLPAEFEPGDDQWQPAEPLPWEPVSGDPGYYSEVGQKLAQLQPDWHQQFQPDDQPDDWAEWQVEFGDEEAA